MRKQSLRDLIASAARVRLSRLLIAAATIHLLFAIAINLAGRYRLAPDKLNENGIGISFAADSIDYLQTGVALAKELRQDGVRAWMKDTAPLHVRLYSLSYASLGGLLGYTTLGAEPLNLIYYLLILTLVFALGREAFDRGCGILAAGITAIWPSILLHTTQLLRDPLFLTLFLIIMLVGVSWLTRVYSWQKGLLAGVAGGVASALVWLVRSQMWEILLAAALLSTAFLIIRQLMERRFIVGNLIGSTLLCIIMVGAPVAGRAFNLYSYPAEQGMSVKRANAASSGEGLDRSAQAQPILPPGSPLPDRISFLRHKFLFSYPGAGSNIDTNVEFHSLTDILLYLPRALMIGLFAPFPNMWFTSGLQVGIEGRLLSGFETLLIYLVEILAAFALWRGRRRLPTWLLLLIILTGILALGLVVANLAALYRMRYSFWLLLIIMGAEGLRQLMLKPSHTKSAA
ncbi:MAG: hypothetical protein ICV60_18320 [Pyrinomonadaceae bacterium]|nr:hypothetical protein [Pyrinomonadaceae bacterium]